MSASNAPPHVLLQYCSSTLTGRTTLSCWRFFVQHVVTVALCMCTTLANKTVSTPHCIRLTRTRHLRRYLNICGRSPQSCTPRWEERSSISAVTQFPGEGAGSCDNLDCTDWDTLQPSCCTADCIRIAEPTGIHTDFVDPANIRTGGLRITWAVVSPSEALPSSYNCGPQDGRSLPIVRTASVVLSCDTSHDDASVLVLGDVVENPRCTYMIPGRTPAACGVLAPIAPNASFSFSCSATPVTSPDKTPSPSSSSSLSPVMTQSGTTTPTSTSTVIPRPSSTQAPRDPGYAFVSSLDRDASVALGGFAVGIALSAAVVTLSLKRMLPWQHARRRGGAGGVLLVEADAAAGATRRGVPAASVVRGVAVNSMLLLASAGAVPPVTYRGRDVSAGACDAFASDINCIFDASSAGNVTYRFDLRGLCSPFG